MSESLLLTLGSFAAVWASVWLLLMMVLLTLHRPFRPVLFRLHPASASAVLLTLCAAPFLVSLLGAVLLYLPQTESALVSQHCHEDCAAHAPVTASLAVAVTGLAASGLLLVLLAGRAARHLVRAMQLTRQLRPLSRSQGAGYRELDSGQPVVFTLGWLRPDVYVSRGLIDRCDNSDLQVILAHERAHRRRRDNLRILIGRLLCLVAPLSWKQRVLDDLELLSEQACDFAAARRFGTVSVAGTLVRVKRILQDTFMDSPELQRFTGAEVEARVRALLGSGERVLLGPLQLGILLAVILTLIVLGVEPMHHATEWALGLID
ncbi:MAG: M48 family metalloprotease [Pseudomonadota bacterium]